MIEIRLSSIANIRDLGETITADGKKIARNRLIRSAMLSNAGAEDLLYLKREHHLDTVLDLRSPSQINDEPDQIGDLNYLQVPVFEQFKNSISEEQIMAHQFPDVTEFMTNTYVELVSDPEYIKGIGNAVKAIMEHARTDGAILWHCSEGKDRTGLIAAILLKMLGVSDEVIVEDYLETNKSAIPSAKTLYDQVKEMSDEEIADYAYRMCIADERYLRAAMEIMGDHFATDVLKIDEKAIEAFRDRILV